MSLTFKHEFCLNVSSWRKKKKKIRYLSEVEIRMTLTTVSNKQSPEDPQKEKHNKLDNLKSRGLRRIFHFSELAGAREGHPQGLGCLLC